MFTQLFSNRFVRVIDGFCFVLLLAVAFLLGCVELFDPADTWWHVRIGQWLLENREIPSSDPFTFGSPDRLWINLHWGFQVLSATIFNVGGIPCLILMAGVAGAGILCLAFTARGTCLPFPVWVLCWLPGLILMSWRFNPRPEVLSLLLAAAFLAILWQADKRPALIWVLPFLQVVWVNTHGLFILGPVIMGCYLAERMFPMRWQGSGKPDSLPGRKRVILAAGGVLLACLINPFFIDGALFPLRLYSLISRGGDLYKEHISEFMGWPAYAESIGENARDLYLTSMYVLLLILPLSFIFPGIWRSWPKKPGDDSFPIWLGGFLLSLGLVLMGRMAFPRGSWLATLGENVPVAFLVLGLGSSLILGLGSQSWKVMTISGLAGVFLGSWSLWLHDYLFTSEGRNGMPLLLWISAAAAGPLVLLLGRQKTSLYRLLMVGGFGYLGLLAVRNSALLGLVGGAVLVWNLDDWIKQMRPRQGTAQPARLQLVGSWAVRVGLAGFLGLWVAALATNQFFSRAGMPFEGGLGEKPRTFAHEAVLFAGQTGLPKRAVVYDIGLAGLYEFHNGPEYKSFVDPRLALPTRDTFANYFAIQEWLKHHDPRGDQALQEMGDPLVLLQRHYLKAQASLLVHPQWRCIYYDSLAAVFVSRRLSGLEKSFPSVDFAARHFGEPSRPLKTFDLEAALQEAGTLNSLALELPPFPEVAWKWRLPVLFAALAQAQRAVDENPDRVEAWTKLGNTLQLLTLQSEPRSGPEKGPPKSNIPHLTDPWDAAKILPWAQATYCFQRARAMDPRASSLHSLFLSFHLRQMFDALVEVGQDLTARGLVNPPEKKQIQNLLPYLNGMEKPSLTRDPAGAVAFLLRDHRPLAALRLKEEIDKNGTWNWALAERLAQTCLHLGQPAQAREIWKRVKAPSESGRLCRLAITFWVERDFKSAQAHYREALKINSAEGEAWWGLAVLHGQRGQSGPSLEACRQGLKLSLPENQRTYLMGLSKLLDRIVSEDQGIKWSRRGSNP